MSGGALKKKQGNLFSFFTKKGKSADATSRDMPAEPSCCADVVSEVTIGTRVAVYWPDDDEHYSATITGKKRDSSSVYTLTYDDGEVETLDLSTETFKILSTSPDKRRVANEAAESCTKRRRILEESEEEFEFHDDDDTQQPAAGDDHQPKLAHLDNDDDDDASMMVTDDDDDFVVSDQRKKGGKKKEKDAEKKRVLVTRVTVADPYKQYKKAFSANLSCTPPRGAQPSYTTPQRLGAVDSGPTKPAATHDTDNPFSDFHSDSATPVHNVASSSAGPSAAITPNESAIASFCNISPSPQKPIQSGAIPIASASIPDSKVVNQAGTHLHNHFTFLTSNRCDSSKRPTSHPDYDPRTLLVDYNEIERVTGSKPTPASRQWWEIKSQYADTVLLFKTGKFYEIFHMDADIAVQVLNFCYMKGAAAHAGFPEIAYGGFAEKLIQAGYKVARVEQTETPEMLKERKSNCKSGQKPMVVNREVCSIMSAGTRTFCYMDDVRCFGSDDSGSEEGYAGIGPLLAIKEMLMKSREQGDGEDGSVQPVCEYGIAVVDALRGIVTLGQFEDDVLRSRMDTLLTVYSPCEILIEGGTNGASPTLTSLLKAAQTANPSIRIEKINVTERFPKSTAVDPEIRKKMERPTPTVHPWDVDETLQEIHRKGYYPRASREKIGNGAEGTRRWPAVLKACISGEASFALSAFGAALYYLQRCLIDEELLSMGIVKAYCPPGLPASELKIDSPKQKAGVGLLELSREEQRREDGMDLMVTQKGSCVTTPRPPLGECASNENDLSTSFAIEAQIDHMSLDGTTLANLEILTNTHSNTSAGSLWCKINNTKSPHGGRLLRAWLLRPLFRKCDIDRRADAVQELVSGGAAVAMSKARSVLLKCGDVERLLSRVHSMGSTSVNDTALVGHHPNDRAVLYESVTHTKRKVGDFSKLLNGLRAASCIPDLFSGVDIKSGLLAKIVKTSENGGCFPATITEQLDWFFDNFDCDLAAKGLFEPTRGMDDTYDAACDAVERIQHDLEDYKNEMCSHVLKPSHVAKSNWNYANTKEDSKDKYMIELPVGVQVPADFYVKGKRGTGARQINKYRTPIVEKLVDELEHAIDIMRAGKVRGMQLVFARFDSMRSLWASVGQATAMLDALGALAETSSRAGYTRPVVSDCPPDGNPFLRVVQGRHPCVEFTHSGEDFIPNDLSLGGGDMEHQTVCPRVLLLSGPNMGGKSTLLRQTCIITVLAQIGCFVPADECIFTPVDRIFTRLGASDRILLGQSTFFVELAETAAALRGATRRSLVIMDELGRGTSTFDGTAIASATVKHLVERNKCLTLFATHYHSLLEDWKDEPSVRLGHMECLVEGGYSSPDGADSEEDVHTDHSITFLYTLGEGSCPKSFGINVARLAALPAEVLCKAKAVSSLFEAELNSFDKAARLSPRNAIVLRNELQVAVEEEQWDCVEKLWEELQRT